MERLNGTRKYQLGERFTVVDLNPIRIPRIDSEKTLVAQLKPRAMMSIVTRTEPDVDVMMEDQMQLVYWQKVFLRADINPRKSRAYEMSTKRRVLEGVYTNRSGIYLFAHESVDQESFVKLLEAITSFSPRLTGQDLSSFIQGQLSASQSKVLSASGG